VIAQRPDSIVPLSEADSTPGADSRLVGLLRWNCQYGMGRALHYPSCNAAYRQHLPDSA